MRPSGQKKIALCHLKLPIELVLVAGRVIKGGGRLFESGRATFGSRAIETRRSAFPEAIWNS